MKNFASMLAELRMRARSTKPQMALTGVELEHMILLVAEEIHKLRVESCDHLWGQYWNMGLNCTVVACKHCGTRKEDEK